MRFEPREPREGINVSPTHPLKEAATLVIGAAVLILVATFCLGQAVDFLVPRLSPSIEARLFGGFSSKAASLLGEELDHPDQERLQALVDRLASHWPERTIPLRVGVLPESAPNALAVPGGLILVTEGLLEEVESENELAFVLGHELGHFRHRDHLRSLGRGLVTSLVFATFSGATDPVGLTGELANRRFGRQQESAADEFGLELVYEEYDHVGDAGQFFSRMAEGEGAFSKGVETYFGTHPASADRVAELHAMAESRGWELEGPIVPWELED